MKHEDHSIFYAIREIIIQSRQRVFRMANSALLETYWHIGKIIVEDEQEGSSKARYGKATLKNLASRLTLEFGKGYDESNLRNIRTFYKAFPIRDALRHELSWTHYRILSRLDSEHKRNYYMEETITGSWNSRELQRQINSMAFERVVKQLPKTDTLHSIQHYIKDPYIFEFLGLPSDNKNTEKTIESAIIDH
ncbi:MAG: hypothetical protein KGP35_05970 [Bacteroidetes bacterium]|nr:hypothetical protein [Bacteroidota bacterium]